MSNPDLKTSPLKKSFRFLLVWGTPLLLAALILQLTTSFRAAKSPVFDETFYLSTALASVKQRTIDPRLCQSGVAPLPIMLNYLPVVWSTGGDARPQPWSGKITDARLVFQARGVNSLLVGIPTMLLVYFWLYRRRGYPAAFFGAALITFSPSMLAHFSLATTDACFTLSALISLAVLTCYWKRPGLRNLFWLAFAVAVAISVKYSGLFLLPCVLLVLAFNSLPPGAALNGRTLWAVTRKLTLSFSLFLLFLLPLIWACHLFQSGGPLKAASFAETPDDSAWVRVLGRGAVAAQVMDFAHSQLKSPAPLTGILYQVNHNSDGHDAYLMGEFSETGWWYYFPLTWVFKSTPVELLFTILGLILSLFFLYHVGKSFRNSSTDKPDAGPQDQAASATQAATDHAPAIWLLAACVLMGMLFTSRINIGQRYLLTLYPLLILFTIDQFCRWNQRRNDRVILLAVFCVAFQIVSFASVKPHYLSYFNSFVGGPAAGHLLLLDSNLDWGQDLPAMQAMLAELPPDERETCLLHYFGTTRPESYGIKAHPLNQDVLKNLDQRKYLVLSANYLQGLYAVKYDPFEPFRSIEPFHRAGYSLFVFKLDTPAAKQALRESLSRLQKKRADSDQSRMTENASNSSP
ncbi:ArnT family glycosyltransferase [Gimesia sp.]|uniref:ArnT family glycosyltransferase n=1 Tax=Gimesia sp. TaxID=2024833 RepID=UPI003A931C59